MTIWRRPTTEHSIQYAHRTLYVKDPGVQITMPITLFWKVSRWDRLRIAWGFLRSVVYK